MRIPSFLFANLKWSYHKLNVAALQSKLQWCLSYSFLCTRVHPIDFTTSVMLGPFSSTCRIYKFPSGVIYVPTVPCVTSLVYVVVQINAFFVFVVYYSCMMRCRTSVDGCFFFKWTPLTAQCDIISGDNMPSSVNSLTVVCIFGIGLLNLISDENAICYICNKFYPNERTASNVRSK